MPAFIPGQMPNNNWMTPGLIPQMPAPPVAAGGATRAGRGSEATGYIPFAPDLGQSSASSIAMNMANMAALKQLYAGVADTYVPGYGGLAGQESSNIAELLNPGRLIDSERYGAEAGSARGIAGSPAAISSAVKRTDEERLRRQLLGSQLLGGAAQRGRGIMPFENFFVNPQQAFDSDWLRNQLAAAPDPAAAYNLNLQNAMAGINAGRQSGYGGGGRSPNPLGGYGGNMISGAPSSTGSRVDDVVRRYAPNLSPTQSGSGNGWGETSNSNGGFASTGNVPPSEQWMIPTGANDVPDYMQPLLAVDWTE